MGETRPAQPSVGKGHCRPVISLAGQEVLQIAFQLKIASIDAMIKAWESTTAESEEIVGESGVVTAARRRRLEKRLADLEAQLERAVGNSLGYEGEAYAIAKKRVHAIQAQRDEVAAEIKAAVPRDAEGARAEQARKINDYAKRLEDLNSPDSARVLAAIMTTISRVDVEAITEQRAKRRRVIEYRGEITFASDIASSAAGVAP